MRRCASICARKSARCTTGCGATSVYVTHDQIEAMTMADHVVVMSDGVIEQQGAPLELYDRPANKFVAGFIGSPAMNFVPAMVGEDGRSLAVDVGEKQTIVLDRQLQPGRKVTAGLRPEHLHFVEPGQGVFRLPVGIVESTGSATYITTSTAAEVTIVETSRRTVRAGDVIDVSIRPADVHVFDGEDRIEGLKRKSQGRRPPPCRRPSIRAHGFGAKRERMN